jgi:hypothetical protein
MYEVKPGGPDGTNSDQLEIRIWYRIWVLSPDDGSSLEVLASCPDLRMRQLALLTG